MKGKILIYCLAGLFLASCAGLKKKEKHQYDLMDNLTSRYNIIFHGKSIIEDVEQKNTASHKENYGTLLPIFIEPTESSTAANTALMDSVIEKARRVINEKDKGKYINEAYFLTGRANYLKGNYYNANEFFDYVANTYADQPKFRQPALIWQARSLMQLGAMSEAAVALDSAVVGMDTHKRSRGHTYAARAQYHLIQGDKQSAITWLGRALTSRGKKQDKLRWHYLIAQLLEDQGQLEGAVSHYRKVARSNASYEAAFHAGLNQAFLQNTGQQNIDEQVRPLRRMLRDDKNKEFRDQILYYIAEAYYQSGHIEEAITFYNRSLAEESNNRHQTALTYLRMADHFFEIGQFVDAQLYYDSTAMFLPRDFPEVAQVQRKITHMDQLISNMQVIVRQDSLQYLATMTDADRTQTIDSLIQEQYTAFLARAEQEAKQAETQVKGQQRTTSPSPFDQNPDPLVVDAYADNRFYFNNPDAIGMGMSAFRRKWGNRELTDNWRFSDMLSHEQATLDGEIAADADQSDASAPNIDTKTLVMDPEAFAQAIWAKYEEELPLDEETLVLSHEKIKTAFQEIGNIYFYELQDHWAAIEIYEDLLGRYPNDEQVPSWYYSLILLYSAVQENPAGYQDRLLLEYPESLYSMMLQNPNYLQEMEESRKHLLEWYDLVYNLFASGEHDKVISTVDQILSDQRPADLSLAAQLNYLKALSIGYTAPATDFEAALTELVDSYPTDNLVTPLAKQHLAFISANPLEFSSREVALVEADAAQQLFSEQSTLLPWPQLVIQTGPAPPRQTRTFETVTSTGLAGGTRQPISDQSQDRVVSRQIAEVVYAEIDPQDTYTRDMELLPDSATYYFVVNVMSARANLAPSRFGIGQFNRGRYAGAAISHQVKTIDNEAQLIYIGPFPSYQDAKRYEAQILPLMPEIMKVPAEIFNTFIITETVFGTLSDFDKVDDYYLFYQDQ